MNQSRSDRWLAGIPPAIVLGAVIVLLPIFGLMTVQNINRQKENSIRLLLEKGAALIRSFEAGARTGMMGDRWRTFKLQSLITETAQQPDIEYILVTDGRGRIHAANDPMRIGGTHAPDRTHPAEDPPDRIMWRIVSADGDRKLFEVFRKFTPMDRHPMRGPGKRTHMGMMRQMSQFFPDLDRSPDERDMMIFIGLDMSSIEAARASDTRHIIMMAGIFLFSGLIGILLLFLVQGYRSTRTSLSRVRAFSDKLVENLPMGLVALDGEERIASVNHVACSMLSIPPARSVGLPADRVLPRDLYAHIALSRKISPADAVEREIDCTTFDGTPIPMEIILSGLADESGAAAGSLVLFRDLREVRALQKEIARSQRLASVGKLAAGVAHEVRNPLSSIKGFATYFKEKYHDIPEDQHIATIMVEEVVRLNRVVSQLLELARPMAIQTKAVPAVPLIENSLKLAERRARENDVVIARPVFKGIETILADPDRLNQVLLNLYLNGIEAMTTGGTLSVELSPDPNGNGVWIRVSDTGYGIPPEDLPHVFDPYFTTKPDGTGLGLANAHNIMEAHGGSIKAESRPGRGTVMQLFLPNEGEGSHDNG